MSRLVGTGRFMSADAYFAYVVVGLVILHSHTATLAVVPNTIRTELGRSGARHLRHASLTLRSEASATAAGAEQHVIMRHAATPFAWR